MIRPPPRSTRTDTLFPYTTLFRALADGGQIGNQRRADPAVGAHLDLSAQFRVAPHEDLQFVERTDDIFLARRSEEHTSELQSLMRISYAVFCLKKKKKKKSTK